MEIKTEARTYNVLEEPMTQQELKDNVTDGNIIVANVLLDFKDVNHLGIEWLNDEVSRLITNDECGLLGISFDPIGVTNYGQLIVEVHGEVDFDMFD